MALASIFRKKRVYQGPSYEQLRQDMVTNQIESRGVEDKGVLDAMRKVPRHLFIPEKFIDEAYEDHPIAIGEGQTISQPFVVAYMTEKLGIQKGDKILEIGTGSGYQTAILEELTPHIYSIEYYPKLAERAKQILTELGYTTVQIIQGNGFEGWEEFAPYDAIIGTCAPELIPDKLIEQLKEGGRMILPVGGRISQELFLIEKHKGKISQHELIPVVFVPMLD